MSVYLVASFAGSCMCTSEFALQTDWRCSIGDTGIQLFETPQCYRAFLKRKSDMTPNTLTCDVDSHVHCLPAVFLCLNSDSELQRLLAFLVHLGWGGGVFLTMLKLPVLVEIDYHHSSNSQQPCTNASWRSQKLVKFP